MERFLNFQLCKDQHLKTSWPKNVALVGNSSNSQGYGDEINKHDLVVRMNRAQYCEAVGCRTDVLTINNWGVPAYSMIRGTEPINEYALTSAKFIWLPVPPEEMATAGPDHGNLPWPAYGDFTQDIIDNLVGMKPYYKFPVMIWRDVVKEFRRRGAGLDDVPSTGAQTLSYIVRVWPKAKITLYGFSHEGWSGHPWDIESAWMKSLPNVRYGNESLRKI